MHLREVDVLVLGSGPAGCAAAISLCQRGRSVAILERERRPGLKIGEHLRPEAMGALRLLGLGADVLAESLRESPGIRVAWGSPELRERDYLFDPSGSGWNARRRELEASLLARAEQAGASQERGVSQVVATREADHTWRVAARSRGQSIVFIARWLIDATGRACWLARRMEATREHVDRQVALVARWNSPGPFADGDRLLVESAPDGWWYSLSLPDGTSTAVYLTDADLLARPGSEASRAFESALAQATHTQHRARAASGRWSVVVRAAQTSYLVPSFGQGWVAAGDAAWASDPLAGIGFAEALESGRSAAEAVDASLTGDGARALQLRESRLRDRIDALLERRLETYRQETRWSERPFWSRRHVTPDRIASITLEPDSWIVLSPSRGRPPAVGLPRKQIEVLLALSPMPQQVAKVARDFMAACPVNADVALRALQALAQVVESPKGQHAPTPKRLPLRTPP